MHHYIIFMYSAYLHYGCRIMGSVGKRYLSVSYEVDSQSTTLDTLRVYSPGSQSCWLLVSHFVLYFVLYFNTKNELSDSQGLDIMKKKSNLKQ